MSDVKKLQELAKLVRFYILDMTTRVGSGHATSSLSAVELMVALYFGNLRYDLKNPQNPQNDRVIFSKGHASPLFYALYRVAGAISEKDLEGYRKFGSVLEGHPRPNFKYAEAATGSLGQGLSIGLGMALTAKLDKLSYMTYVLMGDSEVAEGSVWEAVELASYYKLDNLVGIIDVNRLGQSRETMLDWDLETYKKRIDSFGWDTHIVDGHDLEAILAVFDKIAVGRVRPQMIIAKTIKGKGVPFLENKEGWHGKSLDSDQFKEALFALGKVDKNAKGEIVKPESFVSKEKFSIKSNSNDPSSSVIEKLPYKKGDLVATRKAYGETLAEVGIGNQDIVVLDGEVKNSTYAEIFEEKHKDRYFEMFIAEQNMAGVAVGLAKRGKIPFASTFSAFWTRAHDQIRMAAYCEANIKFVGSHSGVSIGEDGPSQMGLEDIAMFSSILGSTVLVPSDAVSCAKLVEASILQNGIVYIRTSRPQVPVIFDHDEEFKIGGSKILKKSAGDKATIIACGVTVHEALKAWELLKKEEISVRVIDAYSVKPIDESVIKKAASETNNLVITVEDHYQEGGLGDAVLNVFATQAEVKVYKMAVSKMPKSGKGEELLKFEEIDADAIARKVKEVL